jgi:hypothetical protein
MSLTAWSCPSCTLAEGAAIARAPGIGAVDQAGRGTLCGDVLTETIAMRDAFNHWKGH